MLLKKHLYLLLDDNMNENPIDQSSRSTVKTEANNYILPRITGFYTGKKIGMFTIIKLLKLFFIINIYFFRELNLSALPRSEIA